MRREGGALVFLVCFGCERVRQREMEGPAIYMIGGEVISANEDTNAIRAGRR